MNRHYTGVFLIVVSAVGFGLMPIFALQAYRGGINLTTLLLIRFSCAALILFAYLLITGGRIAATWRQILSFYIMGGVLYTLQSTCYFLALKHLSASLTALVLYTYPILVALLSLIFERERLTGRVVCSILLCFAGLVLALGASIGRVDTAGIILAFCAPLVYSCYILAGNRLVKQVPSLVTSAFVALFAATSFLVVGISGRSLSFDFDPRVWLPLAAIVVFSTAVAILAFFKGLELVGSTTASVLSMTEPVVTIGLSVLLLQERLGGIQLAGVAAVLIGSIIVTARKGTEPYRRQMDQSDPHP